MSRPNNDKQMSAVTLRMVLFGLMGLIVLISAAGFIYGVGFVRSYATEVSAKRSEADASNNMLDQLEKTRVDLDKYTDVITKIDRLRANPKSNDNYPEIEIITNVKKLAKNNNLTIDTISQASAAGATSSTGSPQPATPTPAAGTATAPIAASDTVGVSVTFKNPANYKDFLQFLYDVEQTLPILKLDGVSLTPAEDGSSSSVNASALTIHMYIKKG